MVKYIKASILKQKNFLPVALVIIVILFFIKGVSFLDPDFGWHLKMGEIIHFKGIPKTDPFSYTMTSYPFVDHEWLTNLLIYKLFPVIKFTGLSLLSAFLVTLALIISVFRLGRKFWEVPLLLGAITILPYAGVRPQVESWLYLALILLVVLTPVIWSKFKYLVPLFFILWVNLHGSFAAGLVAILIVFVFKSVRTGKIHKDLLAIFLLSLAATFINPYGGRIWWEVWQQISDTNLRWSIVEWQPLFFVFNFPLLAYFSISLIFLVKERRHFLMEELALYFIFLLQAIGSQRQMPLWIIVSMAITAKALVYFSLDIAKKQFAQVRLTKIYKLTLIGTVILVFLQSYFVIRGSLGLSEKSFYPKAAVAFLANKPAGRIFSEYGWGGYLIWKLPGEKDFIDGRMPSWRYNNNPPGESAYAFKDYSELLTGKQDYKQVFAKYNISVVLWPVNRGQDIYANLQNKISKLLKAGSVKPKFDLINEIQKDGWHQVFQDSLSVIYEK